MVRVSLERVAGKARERFHEGRADLFMALMAPPPGVRILDLGSGWGDPFLARIARRVPIQGVLADISEGPVEDASRHGFGAVILEEGDDLPFDDNEFDIVLSNSVIEHVTVPASKRGAVKLNDSEWRRHSLLSQSRFASEIQRIGRRYFVQTPHKHFPLDLHMWMLGTNWLPHPALERLVPLADRYWIKRTGYPDWNLLGAREMRALFPQGKIWVERLLGLPKSVIAYS